MDENQQAENTNIEPTNKYLALIRNNKYNFFFIGAIVILIIIIVLILILTLTTSQKSTTSNGTNKQNHPTISVLPSSAPSQVISQAPSPVVSISPASPSQAEKAITTPDPTQAAEIKSQLQSQIGKNIAVPYSIANITLYGSNWSLLTITTTSAGGGGVIAEKQNGQWTVVLGPGTFFPKQQLESIGAPQSLINNFYPTTSPSPAP